MKSEELPYPQLLAIAYLTTPLIFFLVLLLVGPFRYFASYLFLSWTIAAIISALCFGFSPSFHKQLNQAERLAILAGNALVALFVALVTGFAWPIA